LATTSIHAYTLMYIFTISYYPAFQPMRTTLLLLFQLLLFHICFAQKGLYQKKTTIGSVPAFNMEAMVFDHEDNLYLLDQSRVLKMKDGEVLMELPLKKEDYTSTNPNVSYNGILADMTVDHQQNIFIINNWKRLIEKYDRNGTLLWTIPEPVDQTSLSSYSRRLLIDSNNNLVIFNHLDGDIYYYTTDGAPLKKINIPRLDPFAQPSGLRVALDANDNIFYVETINGSWNATLNFRIFSPEGVLMKEFRAEQLKKEGLTGAQDMRFDKNGNLHFYSFRSTLYIVSPAGELIKKFTPAFQSYYPNAAGRVYVRFDSQNNLYLGNNYANTSLIYKYSSEHKLLGQIGNLRRPRDIVFDKSNNLYILDHFTNKVVKTNLDGEVLLEFSGKGTGVVSPVAIAVDEKDNFYILEAGNNEGIIKKYDPTGKDIAYMYGIVGSFTSDIAADRAGLAIDRQGNMYVSNFNNHTLNKYNPDGKLINTIGTPGKGKGQIWRPVDITVDAADNVYVLDIRCGRIQKFSSQGRFIEQFGDFEPAMDDWAFRGRISSDAFGNLIVGGYRGEHRVVLFDMKGTLVDSLPKGTPGVAMSQDGRYVATADIYQDIVTVYEIKTPREYNFIEGNVFHDLNADCQQNSNESGIAHVILKAEPGPYYAVTDETGNYKIAVGKGTYTVEPLFENNAGKLISQTCESDNLAQGIHFDNFGNYATGNNIGASVSLAPYLSVSVSSTRRRRCFESTTKVRYSNAGFAPAPDAKVYLQLPAEVELLSGDKPHTRLADGTYVFSVGDLAAGQSGVITIEDKVTCGDESVRGLTVCTRAWITPSNNKPTKPVATVTVTGQCNYDMGMVRFVVKNTGTADMETAGLFRKYFDGSLASVEQYRLAAGDSIVLWVPTSGMTVRLEADQPDGNGDNTKASVTVEACRASSTQSGFSTGFVSVLPADDEEAEKSEECMLITDSYDPNDKLVTPVGRTSENYTPTNTALKYKIRFQNTGTDVAYRVVVVDTLSEHLDLSTLQVGATSHPSRFEVGGKGRPVLTWTFDNIMLPDSTADEPGSHGFILFSIKPKADLAEKTLVENFADIFFDFNSPIRTNVTVNRIYDMPPVINEAVRINLEEVLATPAITEFSPAAGRYGSEITITGKRFSTVASENKVYLNGKAATVVNATTTMLRVLVPDKALSGKIQLTTPDGGVTTSEIYEVYQPPVLTGFSPVEGIVGQTVTITGEHLQADLVEGIKLNGLDCEVLSATATSLAVKVPTGAETGRFELITKGGEAMSTTAFVVWHQPVINSLSPESAIVGATIRLNGAHFASDKTRNKVKFGQTLATIIEAAQDQLTVRVPEGAESGQISVETPGGVAVTTSVFEVIPGPKFTAMQPAKGTVGTIVEITGEYFGIQGQQDVIRFNGEPALVLESADNRYKVRVPRGAQTGKVTITGYGGEAHSTADFVVEELAPAEAIQVYPNPNHGRFTVSLHHADFDVQLIEVYDALGKRLHQTHITGS
jgi:hypothetical protein